MLKKRLFCIPIIAALLMAFVSFPITAFAAVGSKSYATVYGYRYEYYSTVHTNSSSVWAGCSVRCLSGNVPAGYIGTLPRLYNSRGLLVKSGYWEYSSRSIAGMLKLTPTVSATGTFYGRGSVRMYNGNGYNTYTTTNTKIKASINVLITS